MFSGGISGWLMTPVSQSQATALAVKHDISGIEAVCMAKQINLLEAIEALPEAKATKLVLSRLLAEMLIERPDGEKDKTRQSLLSDISALNEGEELKTVLEEFVEVLFDY